MQLRFRNNPDVTNSFRKVDVTTTLTTLGFLAGAIDLALHSQSMGDPRCGLELMATLGFSAVAAYRFAEKTLNEIFDEGDQASANHNL